MISDPATGNCRPFVDTAPTLSSAAIPWPGFLMEQHLTGPAEVRASLFHNHVLTLHLSSAIDFEWKVNGRFRNFRKQAGEVSLIPAGMVFSAASKNGSQFLSLSLEEHFFRQSLQDFPGIGHLELLPRITLADSLIEAIAHALRADAASGNPNGLLYGEALITSLAAHLARNHSVQMPPAKQFKRGLSAAQLRRVTDYLHTCFAEEISLTTLAAVAGMSAYHFARLFKASTGFAPHQYHIRCRIERAKELLRKPDARIADIATQVGFCDQSHLAAHFKRAYGVTPGQYLAGIIRR